MVSCLIINSLGGTGIFRNIYLLHDSIVAVKSCIPRILLEPPGGFEQKYEDITLYCFCLYHIDVHWSFIITIRLLPAYVTKLVRCLLLVPTNTFRHMRMYTVSWLIEVCIGLLDPCNASQCKLLQE